MMVERHRRDRAHLPSHDMFPQGPMRNQEKAFTTMQVTIGSNLAKKEAPMQAAFLGFARSPSETSRQSRLHPHPIAE
jgi:hypothetical protein